MLFNMLLHVIAVAASTRTTIPSSTSAIQVTIGAPMMYEFNVEPTDASPDLERREPQPALTVNSNINCYSYDLSIASTAWRSNCEPFFSLLGTPVSIANGCQIGICRDDGRTTPVTPSTSTTSERQRTTDSARSPTTLLTTTFNCRQGPPRGVMPESWARACSTVWATQLPWDSSRSSMPKNSISGSMTAPVSPIADSSSSAAGVAAGTTLGLLAGVALIGGGLYFARKKRGSKRSKKEGNAEAEGKRELPDEPNSRSGGTKSARYRTDSTGNNGLDGDDLASPRPETLDNDGEFDKENGYKRSEDGSSDANPRTPGINGQYRNSDAHSQGPGSPGTGYFDDRGNGGAGEDQSDDQRSEEEYDDDDDDVEGSKDREGSPSPGSASGSPYPSDKSSITGERSPAAESFSSEVEDVVNPLPPSVPEGGLDADMRETPSRPGSTYQPFRPASVTESAYGGAPPKDVLRDINPPPSKAQHYSVANIPREYQSFTDI